MEGGINRKEWRMQNQINKREAVHEYQVTWSGLTLRPSFWTVWTSAINWIWRMVCANSLNSGWGSQNKDRKLHLKAKRVEMMGIEGRRVEMCVPIEWEECTQDIQRSFSHSSTKIERKRGRKSIDYFAKAWLKRQLTSTTNVTGHRTESRNVESGGRVLWNTMNTYKSGPFYPGKGMRTWKLSRWGIKLGCTSLITNHWIAFIFLKWTAKWWQMD